MPDSGIGVVITGKEIYDAVMATKESVTRIESKFGEVEAAVKEHETKLDDLYKKYYQIAGIGGLTGGLALAIVQAIIKAVFGG